MGGELIRAIAASETLSVRRVQQIVREQLDRRDFNPADDFALLQIARLERALDLIGAQIDAGKPSAAHALVRILDQLNRLAPDRLRLKPTFQRVGDEVDKMEERLGRLDAAREALALRRAEGGPSRSRAKTAKQNRPQALDITRNREMADSAALNHFRGLRDLKRNVSFRRAKRGSALGAEKLRESALKPLKSLARVNLCAAAAEPSLAADRSPAPLVCRLFLDRSGQARDIVLDEKRIHDHHRQRTKQRGRHQRAPVVDVAFDQFGDGADRNGLVLRR